MAYKCFTDSGVVSIIFGIITGLVFSEGGYTNDIYGKSIKDSPKGLLFKRFMVFILVILVSAGPFYVVSHLDIFNDPEIGAYFTFFIHIIGGWVTGFNIIYLVSFIFRYFEIDIDGDLFIKRMSNWS